MAVDRPNSGICTKRASHGGTHTGSGVHGHPLRTHGQTCGYAYGLGNVGSCAPGLRCTSYRASHRGGPIVADAPSTCLPAHTGSTGGTSNGMCSGSPRQLCRMLCPQRRCPAGQCFMRVGSCCSGRCQSSSGTQTGSGGSYLKQGQICRDGMVRVRHHYPPCGPGLSCMTWNQAHPNAGAYLADAPSRCSPTHTSSNHANCGNYHDEQASSQCLAKIRQGYACTNYIMRVTCKRSCCAHKGDQHKIVYPRQNPRYQIPRYRHSGATFPRRSSSHSCNFHFQDECQNHASAGCRFVRGRCLQVLRSRIVRRPVRRVRRVRMPRV